MPFKRRKRKVKKSLKVTDTIPTDNKDEPEESVEEALEAAKLFQSLGKRKIGLNFVEQKEKLKVKPKKEEENQEIGDFSTEKEKTLQAKQQEEWVEREFKKELKKQGRVVAEKKTEKQKKQNFMKELYSVPEGVQGRVQFQPEQEAGERWLSGMVEVQLPIEYKLKNIEETEAAKRLLLAPKDIEDKVMIIPQNWNQDFQRAHIDDARLLKHKRKIQDMVQEAKRQKLGN